MTIQISSLQNEHVKGVLKLAKRSERESRGVTVVEGVREIGHALAAGAIPSEAYVCLEVATGSEAAALVRQLEHAASDGSSQLYYVSRTVYAKLAYRAESGGIVAVVPTVQRTLEQLVLHGPAFLVVIEGVEKPGNLGAILRTADAVGVHAVIVSAGATDLFNPNVVRASLGALFTVQVAEATTAETIAWLRQHRIAVVAAAPDAATRYTEIDLTGPVAIVMGSETAGLSPAWRAAADAQVAIPMRGRLDSLNLATSTALLLYEVLRQRQH